MSPTSASRTESAPSSPAPRAAASLVLLRDGASGLEVFLLRRHAASQVHGGAYVFPGGKLDAADSEPPMTAHLDQAAVALHAALNEPQLDAATAAGLYVAALREAFEECGVLYAEAPGQQPADPALAAAALREGLGFAAMLERLGLRLLTRPLQPWSRWITPYAPGSSVKRFDTRFFVAAMPAGQEARHDDHETTDSAWLTPRAALEQYWNHQIEMVPPQIMSLAHLARHDSVAGVLEEARRRAPPVIQPEPIEESGERLVCYPGDARHPVRERALPGPSRMRWHNGRFEPLGGLQTLLA